MKINILIFALLRLYKERLSQVDAKLQEVIAGKAPEYLEPLATLQENMQIRTKVAGRKVKHLFHIVAYDLFNRLKGVRQVSGGC